MVWPAPASHTFTAPFETPGNLRAQAVATLEAFTERRIELYDDPDLVRDLRNLRIVEKTYGVRLDAPCGPSGHGDATVLRAHTRLTTLHRSGLPSHGSSAME